MSAPASVLPTASPQRSRARVARLLSDRRGAVALVVALTATASAASLAGPALIGAVIDTATDATVTADDRRTTVLVIAVAYVILTLVGGLISYVGAVRAAALGESALAEVRTEVFDHALAIDTTTVERGGVGDLVARLTADVDALTTVIRQSLPVTLFSTAQLIIGVVFLVLVDVRLAIAGVVAGAPVAALGVWWYARHAPVRYRVERERLAGLSSLLLELYRGRMTVLAHRADGSLRARAVDAGAGLVDAELWTTAARNRLRPAINLSLGAALAGVVVVGANLADDGAVSVGAVIAAALYVLRLFGPIGAVMEQLDEIQQATAAMARLVGVTDVPVILDQGDAADRRVADTATIPPREHAADTAGADVVVRDVTFAYRPGVPVLVDVSLAVAAGEHIVIVGPSGAGKSTLAKLIAGVHVPDRGQVVVGGRSVNHTAVAASVALLTQEVHVFRRSLRDNVALGVDATNSRIEAALHTVGAHWWIRLPDGLDTAIGDGAYELTAPQAQQVALARVVCANPSVVVLDEATADLDPFAAAETEAHLDTAFAGRTVVTIAHRLDVTARADRVVVMDGGRVVEVGPHSELVHHGGVYADLWHRWSAAR